MDLLTYQVYGPVGGPPCWSSLGRTSPSASFWRRHAVAHTEVAPVPKHHPSLAGRKGTHSRIASTGRSQSDLWGNRIIKWMCFLGIFEVLFNPVKGRSHRRFPVQINEEGIHTVIEIEKGSTCWAQSRGMMHAARCKVWTLFHKS